MTAADRPTPVVHNHGTEDGPGLSCREERLPDGSLRGECIAPVVPDSPDVRERLPFTIDDGNPRVLTFKSGGCRPAKETETAMWDLLAVVGQGVTAAQAWDECVQAVAWAMDNGPDPLRYVAEHNPYRAVVRPTGQEQADG